MKMRWIEVTDTDDRPCMFPAYDVVMVRFSDEATRIFLRSGLNIEAKLDADGYMKLRSALENAT